MNSTQRFPIPPVGIQIRLLTGNVGLATTNDTGCRFQQLPPESTRPAWSVPKRSGLGPIRSLSRPIELLQTLPVSLPLCFQFSISRSVGDCSVWLL